MLYRIRQNGLYGFIDETGKVVVKPEYDLVFDFKFDACVVVLKEKFGLISLQGEILLPLTYASLAIVGKNLLCAKEKNLYALISFKGKRLTPFEYGGIFDFSDGMAAAYKGMKFGYLNEEGAEAISFDYDSAGSFENGYAMVRQVKKFGLLNKNGKYEAPALYDFYYNYENCYIVNIGGSMYDDDINGGKFALLSKNNDPLTELEFDFIGMFMNGETLVKKDGLFGSINEQGKITIPIVHTEAVKVKEESRHIRKEIKHRLLNEGKDGLIPAFYEDLVVYPESKMCWAKKDNLYGILNFENVFIVPPSFELNIIYPIQQDYVHIQLQNKKHGLLALPSGNWLLPPEYDFIGVFKGSLVELKKDNKTSFANREGKIVWME